MKIENSKHGGTYWLNEEFHKNNFTVTQKSFYTCRTLIVSHLGIAVIRFNNAEIETDFESVIEKLKAKLE